MKNEQFATGIVQKLCKKANVAYKDFKESYVKSDAFIVKFHRLEPKDKIFDYAEDRDIWTNELYDLTKGQEPNRVRICHYMTKFYSKLWYTAQKYKDHDRLHSFKLTEKGLSVKRKPNSTEKIVLTTQELTNYVNN